MQATPMKEFERSLIECSDGQSFLPVAAVYGPNAGGKSNLLESLDYVRSAVARPIRLLSASADAAEGDRPLIPRCSAFKFDDVSAAEPTEFELYYRAGEHEYRYALSVHADEIVSEGLWRRKLGASRTAMLFEREDTKVELGPTLRKLVTAARFNPSLPYLSFLCINFDAPVVQEAASWFLDAVFLNYNSSYLERMLEQMLDEGDSREVTRFLRAVDVRIDGFRVERAPEWRGRRVFVRHEVGGKAYELRLSEESAGTQKLMGLAAYLMAALECGGTVVVDELDAKLHPKLLLDGDISAAVKLCWRYIVPLSMMAVIGVNMVFRCVRFLMGRRPHCGRCQVNLPHMFLPAVAGVVFLAVAYVFPAVAWFHLYLLLALVMYCFEWETRTLWWESCPFPLPASRVARMALYMSLYLLILTYGLLRLPPVSDGTTFLYFQF